MISRFNLEEPQVTWGALSPHIGHPITALVGREWDDGGVYSREGADATAGSAGDLGAELGCWGEGAEETNHTVPLLLPSLSTPIFSFLCK